MRRRAANGRPAAKPAEGPGPAAGPKPAASPKLGGALGRLVGGGRGASDPLAAHATLYELCAYCPKMCRFSCPVAEADAKETLTPWGKMGAAFLAAKGALPLDAAVETSWGCTGCGHCTDYCLHGTDVATALVALRATADVRRIRPGPRLDAIPSALKVPDAPILVLPGCGGDASGVSTLVGLVERLGVRGVAFPEATDEARAAPTNREAAGCCGSSLWWSGRLDRFDEHARAFAKSIARRRKVVVADAGCAWTLRVLYPRRKIRLAPQILHVSEWVASFFRERVVKARRRVKGTFYYHDPCTLGRELGIVDDPRAVLAAVLLNPLREFAWNRRDTVCCGGGALLPDTMPDTARRMAEARAEEPRNAGATIVTTCGTCVGHFRSSGVEAVDLLGLVRDAL